MPRPRSKSVSRRRKRTVSRRGRKRTTTRKRSVSRRGRKKTTSRKRSVSRRGRTSRKRKTSRKRSVSSAGMYTKANCKRILSDKIHLYMRAHKYEGRFANPGHAKSAAYGQVSKENPRCKRYFSK